MFRRSTSVSRGSSSGEAPIQTALTQRYSAILAAYLLDHQPLETQVDLRQTPNQPLETRDGRISTKTNEKNPLRWNECRGSRGADGSRNRDLFDANEALYQLSYSPLDVALLRRTTQYTLIRPMSKCKPACVKIGCRLWADMRHCAWGASLGEPSPSDATERNQAGRAANRSGRSR